MNWDENQEEIRKDIDSYQDWHEASLNFSDALLDILDKSISKTQFLKKAKKELKDTSNSYIYEEFAELVRTLEET